METHAPSLGDQIARLHGNVLAQEKCAWIPAPIHTLIIAALSRIFARLGQILQLWQAGQLPPPQPRAPSHRASRRDSARRTCVRTARATRHAPHKRENHRASSPPPIHIQTPPNIPPPATSGPAARPRPTHDPPPQKTPYPRSARSCRNCYDIITIAKPPAPDSTPQSP